MSLQGSLFTPSGPALWNIIGCPSPHLPLFAGLPESYLDIFNTAVPPHTLVFTKTVSSLDPYF